MRLQPAALGLESSTLTLSHCAPKFDALRNGYLNTCYQSGDSLQNFHSIISTNNTVQIKKMCIYINELMKLKGNENLSLL